MRKIYLDWVRVVALFTVVFFHIGMFYSAKGWVITYFDGPIFSNDLLSVSAWRTCLFFVISGVLTGDVFERGGESLFLRRRFTRLLPPLIFGTAFVVPPQVYFESVERIGYVGSFYEFIVYHYFSFEEMCNVRGCVQMLSWKHLWYFAYLFVFSVFVVGFSRERFEKCRVLFSWFVARFGFWAAFFALIVPLSVVRAVVLSMSLVLDIVELPVWASLIICFICFVWGVCVSAVDEYISWLGSRFYVTCFWAVLSMSAIWLLTSFVEGFAAFVVAYLLYGVFQCLSMVGILGFCYRWMNRDSFIRMYLSKNAIVFFVVHQTVIVCVGHFINFYRISLVCGVMLMLVCVAVVGICASWFCSRNAVAAFLFGFGFKDGGLLLSRSCKSQ